MYISEALKIYIMENILHSVEKEKSETVILKH